MYRSFKWIVLIVALVSFFFYWQHINDKQLQQDEAYFSTPDPSPSVEVKKTVYQKLQHKDAIHYLVIGDSIGQSDGSLEHPEDKWYLSLNKQFRSKYNVVLFPHLITTPGGITLGGWIDYLTAVKQRDQIDMVFLCFGQNDQGGSVDVFAANYEALVRQIKKDYPMAEIVTITESSLSIDSFSDRITQISNHYGLLKVDTRAAFNASGKPYDTLTDDGVHPNSQGYTYYTKEITAAIESRIHAANPIQPLPQDVLYDDTNIFETGKRQAKWENAKGFSILSNGLAIGKAGSSIEHIFTGSLLGIEEWADTKGATFNVYVDGTLITQLANECPFRINWEKYVSHKLSSGAHRVRIEVPNDIPKDRVIEIAGIITS